MYLSSDCKDYQCFHNMSRKQLFVQVLLDMHHCYMKFHWWKCLEIETKMLCVIIVIIYDITIGYLKCQKYRTFHSYLSNYNSYWSFPLYRFSLDLAFFRSCNVLVEILFDLNLFQKTKPIYIPQSFISLWALNKL